MGLLAASGLMLRVSGGSRNGFRGPPGGPPRSGGCARARTPPCAVMHEAPRSAAARAGRPLAAKAVDLLGRWRAGSTLRPRQRFPSSCHAKSAAVEATSRRSRAGTWLATAPRNALPVAVQVSSRRTCPSLNSESYWQVSLAAAVSLGSAAVSLRILGRPGSTARWRDRPSEKAGRASGARSALAKLASARSGVGSSSWPCGQQSRRRTR
jgi:hypothetical protein